MICIAEAKAVVMEAMISSMEHPNGILRGNKIASD